MIFSLLMSIIGMTIPPSTQIEISTIDTTGKSGGSGVIIDKNIILTAYHVLEDAKSAKATCGEKIIEIEAIAFSKQLDLALVKYKEKCDITPIKIAPENEPIGSDIYLIGFPSEMPIMVTKGIVSSYSLDYPTVKPLMWSDVKSWFGNSGGAAINTKGELVGIAQSLSTPFQYKADNNGVDMSMQQYTILSPVTAIKLFLTVALGKK